MLDFTRGFICCIVLHNTVKYRIYHVEYITIQYNKLCLMLIHFWNTITQSKLKWKYIYQTPIYQNISLFTNNHPVQTYMEINFSNTSLIVFVEIKRCFTCGIVLYNAVKYRVYRVYTSTLQYNNFYLTIIHFQGTIT